MLNTENELSEELDGLIKSRLFGDQPWLAGEEDRTAMETRLRDLGFMKSPPTDWEPIIAFLGVVPGESLVMVLDLNDMIDEHEADRLLVALRNGSEPSELLKPVVQRAYFDYCRTKGVLDRKAL